MDVRIALFTFSIFYYGSKIDTWQSNSTNVKKQREIPGTFHALASIPFFVDLRGFTYGFYLSGVITLKFTDLFLIIFKRWIKMTFLAIGTLDFNMDLQLLMQQPFESSRYIKTVEKKSQSSNRLKNSALAAGIIFRYELFYPCTCT